MAQQPLLILQIPGLPGLWQKYFGRTDIGETLNSQSFQKQTGFRNQAAPRQAI
jgi:hypothetical protein